MNQEKFKLIQKLLEMSSSIGQQDLRIKHSANPPKVDVENLKPADELIAEIDDLLDKVNNDQLYLVSQETVDAIIEDYNAYFHFKIREI